MDKLRMESPDMTAQNIDRLAALFPNCVTEMLDEEHSTPEKKVYKRAVNFELLKQMLSPDVVDGDEAYEFTWVGKKAAIVEANKPIRKTLRPCVEESKNWDTTENLYIEGDNLEVLKLLQESYLGKVKMIYIDPPYNTGNDFIYADDFMRSQREENQQMGMYDEDENRLFKNTDTNGKFHSDWCSMIYSRLMLARNLLTDDGVIFISIDDNEQENLKKICNEVFGDENFVFQIAWRRTDNQPNIGNIARVKEYILCYAKSLPAMKFGRLPMSEKAKSEYRYSDEHGLFRRAILLDKTRGRYHYPVRTKSGNILNGPWMKSEDELRKLDEQGLIYWTSGGDEQPYGKIYLDESKGQIPNDFWGIDFGTNQRASLEVEKIFQKRFFDFPKPVLLLSNLIKLGADNDSVVLDFFSGSSTTAHAIMQLNAEDGGHRKFIMVQLPEKCDEASEAYKAGYKNICEIGKERIRRAGEKIRDDIDIVHKTDLEEMQASHGSDDQMVMTAVESIRNSGTLTKKTCTYTDKETGRQENVSYESGNSKDFYRFHPEALDIGFRVLKLDDTNMKDVYYAPDDYDQGMLAGLESNIKDDRTDLDLLFGCLIDWGLPLSLPYKSEQIDGCTVHTYNDGDLIACFDANIPESVVKEIAKRKPLRAVFRDSGFASSPEKINVFEIFKLYAPDTGIKVL